MVEQNIHFHELYKRLDNLCKDCFNSQEGVSEYIKQMEKYMLEGKRYITNWEKEYKDLKHIRWIRNQLAHEIGTLNSDIVENSDISFVANFYNKIIKSTDPLSVLGKYKKSQNQTTKQRAINYTPTPKRPFLVDKNYGFFSRLLIKIKKFFE